MAASGFTLESVKQFIIGSGGKVKNHELVTHFKSFLNDQSRKDEMREKFKNYVNELATIKLDEGEKLLVLKKKYRLDSGGADWDQSRACSEPPTDMAQRSHADRPDGNMSSRVKSDGNLSASDLRLSTSTLSTATDSASLASTLSTTSLDSTVTPEEDNNMSVVSVKERAKHLNRMESESEIQKTAVSPLSATRKKDLKKSKDKDDGYESASSSGYVSLDPLEKEWIVTSSAADYHPMHQLLSKNPHLAKLKDFSGTALHWACKHGRPEVVKLLMGKPGVNVNQRTGYTPLHIAAIHGHEEIIELLVQGFKADPNIRDYSGKKAKQYLRNSASSRAQQLLVSSRLSANSESNQFMRNTGGRRSNRSSALKSLIQASSSAMRQTVIRSSWGSTEDVSGASPSVSPRNSAEPSPVTRRKGSFSRDKELMPPPSAPYRGKQRRAMPTSFSRDKELMPPPSAPYRGKQRRAMPTSVSKESLMSEDKRLSLAKQVSRSESEPNLGEATQPSRSTVI